MAIAKMALVSIAGDLGQLDDVIMQCLGSGAFHPEPPLQAAGGIRGFTPLAEENEIAVVRAICNKVAVIDASEFVEWGDTAEIFKNPKHDMTKQLLGYEVMKE